MTTTPRHDSDSASDNDVVDVFNDEILSIAQAARSLPSVREGKKPHPNTIIRWAKSGIKSKSGRIIRLEIFRVGGTTCTSVSALRRFFDRLNDIEPVNTPQLPAKLQKALTKQAEEAENILKKRGLLE
jgi:hypothetical protein